MDRHTFRVDQNKTIGAWMGEMLSCCAFNVVLHMELLNEGVDVPCANVARKSPTLVCETFFVAIVLHQTRLGNILSAERTDCLPG